MSPDEFFSDSFDRWVMSQRDTDGRPLGELRTPPSLREGIPMELRTCPYPGSRHRHAKPMNVSALRQMTAHWDELVAGLEELRAAYLARRPRERLVVLDVYQFVRTGALLPAYLARSASTVAERPIAVPIAVINKVLSGYFSALYEIAVERALEDGEMLTEASADEIVAFVESRGMFIGEQQVCAGSEAMVREVLDIVLHGRPPTPRVLADTCDLDREQDYAESVLQLEYTKGLLWLHAWWTRREVLMATGAAARIAELDAELPSMGVRWSLDDVPEEERADTNAELLRRATDFFATAMTRVRPPRRATEAFIALCGAPGEARTAEAHAARYVTLERAALAAINELRTEIHATLGHRGTITVIGESDITTTFGKTPRDLVAVSLD